VSALCHPASLRDVAHCRQRQFALWNYRDETASEPTADDLKGCDIIEGPVSTGSQDGIHGETANERVDYVDQFSDELKKNVPEKAWAKDDGTWQAAFLTNNGLQCLTVEKVTPYKDSKVDKGWCEIF
jgi:hypothetical protein